MWNPENFQPLKTGDEPALLQFCAMSPVKFPNDWQDAKMCEKASAEKPGVMLLLPIKLKQPL